MPDQSQSASLPLAATSEATFAVDVEAARGLVIVDVWAEWCQPCKAVKPVLEALAAQYAGRATFVTLNGDEAPALSRRFSVRSLPTLLAFKQGVQVDVLVGAQPRPAITKFIDRLLGA